MSDLNDELERLHRENETLRLAYDDYRPQGVFGIEGEKE